MQRGLEAALGHKLVYSEFYNCVHNFETCEYVNLQKSHDFDLALPIRDDMKYIVMVRERKAANMSWVFSNQGNLDLLDSDYYEQFCQKWVMDSKDNLLVVNYEILIHNKLATLIEIAEFMGCTNPDYTNIGEWLKREERFK